MLGIIHGKNAYRCSTCPLMQNRRGPLFPHDHGRRCNPSTVNSPALSLFQDISQRTQSTYYIRTIPSRMALLNRSAKLCVPRQSLAAIFSKAVGIASCIFSIRFWFCPQYQQPAASREDISWNNSPCQRRGGKGGKPTEECVLNHSGT